MKLFKKTFYADIVKTEEEKRKIFDLYHNSCVGGHGGESKTRNKIAEHFYWPGLTKYVEKRVSSCFIKVVTNLNINFSYYVLAKHKSL